MSPVPLPGMYTLGIEEEYQIIDPHTRDLSSSAVPLLQEARKTLDAAVQYEMQLSQIEVATPICHTLSQAQEQLTHLRREVINAATRIGMQVAAAGTHPFAQWQDQHLSPGTRYSAIQDNYQQLAREQSIFACHIHVHVADRAEALQIMNHARGWLAILLALTGNSPFFQHTDTGYASYRSQIWARWPFSGPPNYFSSLAEYDDLLNTLLISNSIENSREVYWDMRLSARFDTLEVRIADVPLSIEETVMLAGLVRALVQTCHTLVQQASTIPLIRQEILHAVHWQAARYGLDATLLDPLTTRMIPARQLLTQFLHFVRPALETQGDWTTVLNTIKTILHTGTGATRQRELYQQTGSLQAVVDFIVQETASGTGAVPIII